MENDPNYSIIMKPFGTKFGSVAMNVYSDCLLKLICKYPYLLLSRICEKAKEVKEEKASAYFFLSFVMFFNRDKTTFKNLVQKSIFLEHISFNDGNFVLVFHNILISAKPENIPYINDIDIIGIGKHLNKQFKEILEYYCKIPKYAKDFWSIIFMERDEPEFGFDILEEILKSWDDLPLPQEEKQINTLIDVSLASLVFTNNECKRLEFILRWLIKKKKLFYDDLYHYLYSYEKSFCPSMVFFCLFEMYDFNQVYRLTKREDNPEDYLVLCENIMSDSRFNFKKSIEHGFVIKDWFINQVYPENDRNWDITDIFKDSFFEILPYHHFCMKLPQYIPAIVFRECLYIRYEDVRLERVIEILNFIPISLINEYNQQIISFLESSFLSICKTKNEHLDSQFIKLLNHILFLNKGMINDIVPVFTKHIFVKKKKIMKSIKFISGIFRYYPDKYLICTFFELMKEVSVDYMENPLFRGTFLNFLRDISKYLKDESIYIFQQIFPILEGFVKYNKSYKNNNSNMYDHTFILPEKSQNTHDFSKDVLLDDYYSNSQIKSSLEILEGLEIPMKNYIDKIFDILMYTMKILPLESLLLAFRLWKNHDVGDIPKFIDLYSCFHKNHLLFTDYRILLQKFYSEIEFVLPEELKNEKFPLCQDFSNSIPHNRIALKFDFNHRFQLKGECISLLFENEYPNREDELKILIHQNIKDPYLLKLYQIKLGMSSCNYIIPPTGSASLGMLLHRYPRLAEIRKMDHHDVLIKYKKYYNYVNNKDILTKFSEYVFKKVLVSSILVFINQKENFLSAFREFVLFLRAYSSIIECYVSNYFGNVTPKQIEPVFEDTVLNIIEWVREYEKDIMPEYPDEFILEDFFDTLLRLCIYKPSCFKISDQSFPNNKWNSYWGAHKIWEIINQPTITNELKIESLASEQISYIRSNRCNHEYLDLENAFVAKELCEIPKIELNKLIRKKKYIYFAKP